ncbi:MAG: type II secretion system F family protein [Lachnospiraceae bacterium]|nr:type II secretion system F family protein [Lachnospiraceae bacterium]
MFSVAEYVIYGIGLVILLCWLAFFFLGLKHASLFEPLEEKDYPFKEIYIVGYAVMEMLRYKYTSKSDKKLRKELEILYEKKYVDYYIRVIYAQKVTFFFTLLTLAVPFYGLTGSYVGMGIIVMFAALAYYYFGTQAEAAIKARSEQMLSEFSDVVSKLALLTNAGMIMHEAWATVASAGEGPLYEEMRRTVDEMNNGMSEIDAYYMFGNRCFLAEVKKFTSTIVQGMTEDSSELTRLLREQSAEVWNIKKQNARRLGEKAAGKLLMPTMLMFIGILIMILIPIFTNLGV